MWLGRPGGPVGEALPGVASAPAQWTRAQASSEKPKYEGKRPKQKQYCNKYSTKKSLKRKRRM